MTTVNFRALLRAEREKLKRAVKTEKEAGEESRALLNWGIGATTPRGGKQDDAAHDRAYEAVMRASLDSAQFKLMDMQEYAMDGPPAGVFYVPDWIDDVTEARIMDLTYQIPAAHPHWVQVRGRRLQCFGGKPADAYTPEPLPPWLSQLCEGLVTSGIFPADLRPNHVLLNEYNKGDGIMPHTDGPFYTPLVAILSLHSPVMLHFWKRKPPELIGVDHKEGSPVASLVLRSRSLLVFSHEAYTDFLHGIEGVEAEQVGAKARVMNLEVRHAGTELTKQDAFTVRKPPNDGICVLALDPRRRPLLVGNGPLLRGASSRPVWASFDSYSAAKCNRYLNPVLPPTEPGEPMTTPHHHAEEPLELIVGSTRVQLGRQLGEGGFAFIYVAIDSNTSARYVLKKTIIQDVTTRDLVKKEVKLLKRLQHPNIVQYVDSCVVPAGSGRKMEAMILMEYCSGGSLMEVIRKRGSHRFEKTDIMRISMDTASALALLHHQSPPIAHRDMKLENVLLNHKGMYKLIDFGSAVEGLVPLTNAAERSEEEERIAKYTTPMYRSPEMVDLYMRRQLDEKVDIWALGCIFFAVVHLVHPLTETGNLAILNRRIRKVTVPPDLVDMQELIDRMLQVDADARLDINEVLQLLELIAAEQPLPPRTRIGKQEEQERKVQAAKAVSPRSRRMTTSPTAPPPPVEARKLDPNSAAARRLAQRGMGATGGAAMSGTTSLLDVSLNAAAERETVPPSEGIQALSFFDGPSEQQSARRPSGEWSAPPQARRPSFDSAPPNVPFSSPAQQLPLSNDSPFGDDFAMFGAAPVGGARVTATTADDTLNECGGGVGGQALNDGGEADWLASFSSTPGPVSPAPPAQDLSIDTFFSNPSVDSTNTGSSLAFAPFGEAPSPAVSTPKAFQMASSPAHALFHSPSSACPHAQSGNRPTTPSTAELLSLPLPAQPTPTPPRAPAFIMSPHSGANDPLAGLPTPTSLPPRSGGHLRLGSFGSGGGSGSNMTMGGYPAPASSTSTSVDPFAALTPEVVSPATSQRASYGSASPSSASYSSPVYASPYGSGSMARGPSYGFASPMGSVSSMGSMYSSGGGLSTVGSQGGMGMGGASPTLYQTPQGSPQVAAYGSGASSAQMFMPPRPQQAPAYGSNPSGGVGHPMTQYQQQPPYAQQQQQPLGTKAAKAADPFADLSLGF